MDVRDFDFDLVPSCDRGRRADDLVVRAHDCVATLECRAWRERTEPPGCMLEARSLALDRECGCAAKPVMRVHKSFAATIDHRASAALKSAARSVEPREQL